MNGFTMLVAFVVAAAAATAVYMLYLRSVDSMSRSQRRAQRARGALARISRSGDIHDTTVTPSTLRRSDAVSPAGAPDPIAPVDPRAAAPPTEWPDTDHSTDPRAGGAEDVDLDG